MPYHKLCHHRHSLSRSRDDSLSSVANIPECATDPHLPLRAPISCWYCTMPCTVMEIPPRDRFWVMSFGFGILR